MARYREKILPLPATLWILAGCFLVIYAPWALGDRGLSWSEGCIAAQAMEMLYAPLPMVMMHGEAIPNAFPLFPMMTGALMHGMSAEFALRSLSLLGLLGCVILVGIVTGKTRNLASAACAGAMMFSTILVFDKTHDGLCNWLFILIIFGGQLAWYYYAAIRSDWSKAWLVCWIAGAIGFYLNGAAAPGFLFIPLIFMRRPLGIFRRLRQPGFVLGAVIFALTALVWYLPYHLPGINVALRYPRTGMLETPEYILHLLSFPWDFAWRLFPWCFLAWAPFCVALRPLDETPIFGRFLRTVFIADFFWLWLSPIDEVHDWLILVPPLAVLTGLHYEIVIRRYGKALLKITNLCCVFVPMAGILLALGFLLPAEHIQSWIELSRSIEFSDRFGETVFAVAAGFAMLTGGAFLLQMRIKPPLWAYWLMLFTVPVLVYQALVMPYCNQDSPHRVRGQTLNSILMQELSSDSATIYKYEFNDLFAESCYLNYPVRKVPALESLPKGETPVIYLLSNSFPTLPERNWRNLLPAPLEVHGRKLYLWRGEWQGSAMTDSKLKPLELLGPLNKAPEAAAQEKTP